ncbi:hypothetical protein ACOSP7_023514 [Xanthoceras sorbifolium]
MNSLKKGSMGMADYILKVKGFADCLTSAGQPTSDQDVIMSVLNGLGLEYDSVVVNLTSREDHVTLNLLNVMVEEEVTEEAKIGDQVVERLCANYMEKHVTLSQCATNDSMRVFIS